MAHDLVIRGGTIVDGTGTEAYRGDVAIDGDRIVEIGTVDATSAARVIDADGAIVTPGFVDLHSHLDAQVGWDPTMSSSCWHGVTSVVMGNCGMTFAPLRPGHHEVLANMMESVEDIPASAILDGLAWNWETYGDYLNRVEEMPKGMNCGGYVGDVALRVYVCGERSIEPEYRATEDELAQMAALVEEALNAGALGYSISRSLSHKVPDGRFVPGTFVDPVEYRTIAEPLRRLGKGVLEAAPRYNDLDGSTWRVDEEVAWMADLSRFTGRPFSFNLLQMKSLGDHYRRVIELCDEANRTGAQVRHQTTPRQVGILFGLGANSLLDSLASWAPLRDRPFAERLAALRDPALRANLVAEGVAQGDGTYGAMYLLTPESGAFYEYAPSDTIAARAAAAGVHPVEFYLDALDATDGRAVANWPVLNNDYGAIEEQLASPASIMGLADAGAHATQIMDASQPTFLLSHWVRDRGTLRLEDAVRRLSSDTADFVGFRDRGRVAVGAFADLNVIDFDNLALPIPEIVNDFPTGAPRFVQRAEGMLHTIVNGRPFMDHGEHTGSLSGRVLRS